MSDFVIWCTKNGYRNVVARDIKNRERIKTRREGWEKNTLPENHVNDKRKYYRQEYLTSEHWKLLRDQAINLYRNCSICGLSACEVHHLNYRNLYDVKLSDLRTVCRRCHSQIHKLQESGNLKIARKSHYTWKWHVVRQAVIKSLGITNPEP